MCVPFDKQPSVHRLLLQDTFIPHHWLYFHNVQERKKKKPRLDKLLFVTDFSAVSDGAGFHS